MHALFQQFLVSAPIIGASERGVLDYGTFSGGVFTIVDRGVEAGTLFALFGLSSWCACFALGEVGT